MGLLCLIPIDENGHAGRPDSSQLLYRHVAPFDAVAFAPDGRCLAWSGWDGTLGTHPLGSAAGAETNSRFRLEDGRLGRCLAFSPDGILLAVGLNDGKVKLLDSPSTSPRFTIHAHGLAVRSVAFSPDQAFLATGSADSTVKLWELPSGALRISLQGHRAGLSRLAFDPAGQLLASTDTYGQLIVWDWSRGRQLASLLPERPPSHPVVPLVFLPDEKTLAVCNLDHQITLWDVTTRSRIAAMGDGERPIAAMNLSADGKTIVTAGGDGLIEFWESPLIGARPGFANIRGWSADSPSPPTAEDWSPREPTGRSGAGRGSPARRTSP